MRLPDSPSPHCPTKNRKKTLVFIENPFSSSKTRDRVLHLKALPSLLLAFRGGGFRRCAVCGLKGRGGHKGKEVGLLTEGVEDPKSFRDEVFWTIVKDKPRRASRKGEGAEVFESAHEVPSECFGRFDFDGIEAAALGNQKIDFVSPGVTVKEKIGLSPPILSTQEL